MPTLNRLERIISVDLPVIIHPDQQLTPVTVSYMMEDFPKALAVEAERIKRNIMQTASDMVHRNELRRFIQRNQYRLIMLDSRLIKSSDRATGTLDQLCKVMHVCLNDLLAFMEAHFGRYMYWNAWVHKTYLTEARREVALVLTQTSEVLTASTSCDRLKEILNKTFQRFLDPQLSPHITYARLRYIERLQRELIRLTPGEASHERIQALLLTLNFNSRTYFDYWSDQLSKVLEQKPTTLEKLTLLAHAAKRIRQHAFINRASYNPNALPLPEMMTKWIREESDELEKLFQWSVAVGEPSGEKRNDLTTEKKTELGVSVAVLAAAIRSLVSSKTIPDENLTSLARMLSKCFTTIRSGGSFSTETFRQSYYNINDSTKQSVIDIFQKAIQWLKKN